MACIASISITPQDGAAQSRSHSNWIFGTGCSLSWNADNQISTGINPVINTYEGVATFSDPVTGQLLLYTDGVSGATADGRLGDALRGLPRGSRVVWLHPWGLRQLNRTPAVKLSGSRPLSVSDELVELGYIPAVEAVIFSVR